MTTTECAHEYREAGGQVYRRKVSEQEYNDRKPDGHDSEGHPYWNYRQFHREVGEWEEKS